MKAITSEMEAHLALDLTTLASCWKVTRTDGTIFGFTDHDQDLTVDGLLYVAASGYFRSAIANSATTAVDNLEVKGFLNDDSISESDLRNGAYDYASVEIFAVNWADLSMGIIRLRYGIFGEVNIYPSGLFIVELRGLTQLFAQMIGEVYAPECRADLGDSRCKIKLVPDVRQSVAAYATGQRVLISQDTGEVAVKLDVLNAGFELVGGSFTSGWTRTGDFAALFSKELFGVTPFADTTSPFAANRAFLAALSTGSISALHTTMPAFTFPLNGLWQLVKIQFVQWQVASGWEVKGTLECLNSSGATLATVNSGFGETSAAWVARESALIHVPIGTTKFRMTFEIQNSGGIGPYPQVLIDNPTIYWHEGDPADSPPEDSPSSFHFGTMLVGNGFNDATVGEASFWMTVSLNGTVEGGNAFLDRRGPNVNMAPQVGDYYGRTSDISLPAGAAITQHYINLLGSTQITGADIDAGDYDIILTALTAAEEFGWQTGMSVKFYDASKAYLSGADIVLAPETNRPSAQWKRKELRDTVPATARYCKVVLAWDRDSEQTAGRPRAGFDDVTLTIAQQSYTTDNLLRFGNVEFNCTTAGTTGDTAPDVSSVIVGDTVVDGSVVWTVVAPQYTQVGEVDGTGATNTTFLLPTVDAANDFLPRGVIHFYSGQNAFRSVEVDSWDNATKTVVTMFPLPHSPATGDSFSIHAGCDLSREQCFSRFNNILNFRGEPDIPGTDQYFKIGGQ